MKFFCQRTADARASARDDNRVVRDLHLGAPVEKAWVGVQEVFEKKG
jgi:hypothetical protein